MRPLICIPALCCLGTVAAFAPAGVLRSNRLSSSSVAMNSFAAPLSFVRNSGDRPFYCTLENTLPRLLSERFKIGESFRLGNACLRLRQHMDDQREKVDLLGAQIGSAVDRLVDTVGSLKLPTILNSIAGRTGPSNKARIGVSGFRARKLTPAGRRVIANRRKKGRAQLIPSPWKRRP